MLNRLKEIDRRAYQQLRRQTASEPAERIITLIYLTTAIALVGNNPKRLAAAVVAAGLSEASKRVFLRRRPYQRYAELVPSRDWQRSSSFPSSHSAAAFAAASADLRATSLCLASILSLSRVSGGQHYPADVVSGAALGLLVGLIINSCSR